NGERQRQRARDRQRQRAPGEAAAGPGSAATATEQRRRDLLRAGPAPLGRQGGGPRPAGGRMVRFRQAWTATCGRDLEEICTEMLRAAAVPAIGPHAERRSPLRICGA